MFAPILPILSDAAAQAPATSSDYALGFGVMLLFLVVPHFIAAKMLADKKATAGRVLGASLLQIIFGIIILVANITLLAVSGMVLMVGAPVSFILLSFVIAGVYGFGFWRGALYNVITIAAFYGIALLLVSVLTFEPVRKILQINGGAAAGMKEGARGEPPEVNPSPGATPDRSVFGSTSEAQAAALKKYPNLGVAGSPFNKRFVEIHTRYKKEKPALMASPDWPMVIADEVASLGIK